MSEDEITALVEVLREAAKILPIKTRDGQDYAEATGTDFQAMTVRPSAFDAMNSLPGAINLIEWLAAENARLREALEPFARVAEHDIGADEDGEDVFWPMSNARYSMAGRLRVKHLRRARAALEGGEG